jgi:hypothetical protein
MHQFLLYSVGRESRLTAAVHLFDLPLANNEKLFESSSSLKLSEPNGLHARQVVVLLHGAQKIKKPPEGGLRFSRAPNLG